MSKGLPSVTLQSLLPPSLAGDEQMAAMAAALQPQLDEVTGCIPAIELYARIDELPEPVLRLLAWENRVYGAEWRLARTLEEKRALVRDSFLLHKRRGTRWAVERIFQLLGMQAEIVEWWEGEGAPATFRVSIADVSNRGILEVEMQFFEELLQTYKPMTRHVTEVDLIVDRGRQVFAHGAASFVMAASMG